MTDFYNWLSREVCLDYACTIGNLERVKALVAQGANVHYENDRAFRLSCLNGRKDVAMWLHQHGGIQADAYNYGLMYACQNGNIELAKWVHGLGYKQFVNKAFFEACIHGQLEAALWLRTLRVDVRQEATVAMPIVCGRGMLVLARLLAEQCGAEVHLDSFVTACGGGSLEVAQWLHSFGGFDNHDAEDGAFQVACVYGCLPTAKWLYAMGRINIADTIAVVFPRACIENSVDTAKWLYGLYPLCIDEELMDQVFQYNARRVIDWLCWGFDARPTKEGFRKALRGVRVSRLIGLIRACVYMKRFMKCYIGM